MPSIPIQIRVFDPQTASEQEFAAYNTLHNRLRAEVWPEDPPIGVEERIRNLRTEMPYEEPHRWIACDGEDAFVGSGSVHLRVEGDNQHAVWFDAGVQPDHRRLGIGSAILARAARLARERGRRVLMTATDSMVPAGDPFLERLGATVGLTERVSQLALGELNRELVREWLARAPEAEFELGVWGTPYPEEALGSVATLKEAMNTAPRETLQLDDEQVTPELIRQADEALVKRKVERWTVYARHRESGEVAGYTEVYWSAERPANLQQGDTAVIPAYRGHGLGRWLKAAMVDKVLADRPAVRRIRTDNANSNAPMLKINVEMGFRPYKEWKIWQIDVGRLCEALTSVS